MVAAAWASSFWEGDIAGHQKMRCGIVQLQQAAELKERKIAEGTLQEEIDLSHGLDLDHRDHHDCNGEIVLEAADQAA